VKAFDCDTLFGPWPADERDTSLEALLSGMQRLGITKALAASTIGLFWHQDVGNETTLKVCSQHRQLVPMATLNPRSTSDASREVQRLARDGFKAIRFYNHRQDWPLTHPVFVEALAAAADLKLPCIVDCYQPGSPTDLLKALPPLNRSPDFRVIMTAVRYWNFTEVFAVMRRDPRLLLSVRYLNLPDTVQLAAATVGPDRLVLASSYPSEYALPFILEIRNSGLPDHEQEKILWQNAASLISA